MPIFLCNTAPEKIVEVICLEQLQPYGENTPSVVFGRVQDMDIKKKKELQYLTMSS